MGNRQHAEQLYQQGLDALNTTYPDKHTHAYKCFAAACFADPMWFHAWYQCGNNNVDLKLREAGIACYYRALQCEAPNGDRARAMSNLAWQLEEAGDIDQAFDYAKQAVTLDPFLSHAHLNLSIIYRDLDDAKASLHHAEEAMRLDPADIQAEIATAFACLFDRQFARGLKHFERRFEWRLHHFMNYPYPRWDGSGGKTVLLVADQGLGDTLSYARFVRELCARSKFVHMVIQSELSRLFMHAFGAIPNLNIMPGLNQPFPAADGWTTFVSLPHALGLSDEEIVSAPHIDFPVYGLPTTWKVPDRRLHIGIAWRGSPLNDIDRHRNIPLDRFMDLYDVPGIQLYSLQVGEFAREVADQGAFALIRDLTPYVRDVVDTVSLLQELDMVITTESALGHICALVGKECWIPYSFGGRDYRLGLRGESPIWTPKHRVFRQEKGETWQPAFEKIKDALRERLSKS